MRWAVPWLVVSACGGEPLITHDDSKTSAMALTEGTSDLGLVGTEVPGFIIEGELPPVNSGFVVVDAGDVNGDGLGDTAVTIRPYSYLTADPPVERAYVVFGKSDTDSVRLSDIVDGIGGFVVEGPDERAHFKAAASGDVNGDGLSDLVLGAPGFNGGGTVYVVLGKADTLPVKTADLVENQGGFAIQQRGPHALGLSVATGDVNGDGLSDVIAGSAPSVYDVKGKVFVAFGDRDPKSTIVPRLAKGVGGFVVGGRRAVRGEFNMDSTGLAVSSADVNGDGYSDLVIGDFSFGYYDGRVSVVFGKTDTAPVDLTDFEGEGFVIDAGVELTSAGQVVSTAGDMNGDGYADIAISCSDSGDIGQGECVGYVVFGKDSTDPVSLADVARGLGGFALRGPIQEGTGFSLSGGVDLNADAVPDLVIGGLSAFELNGGAYVVYGKSTGEPVQLAQVAAGVGGYALRGEQELSRAGFSVAAVEDMNGDDIGDVVVGAPFFDGEQDRGLGRSYVVFGTADPPPPAGE